MATSEGMWEWGGPLEEILRPRRRNSRSEDESERGMPLPPMSPLWREHGKGDAGGGIHVAVCCCNEEEEELQVMLSTFRTDLPPSCHVRVSFIVDCHSPADFGPSSETYEAIRSWPLGARYEGEFKSNLQHGEGTLTLPNGGGGYSGEWHKGFQHGKGTLTTPDGQTCEGDFVGGNPHGKGVMKTPQGMVYEGDFEDGLPHGKGVTTYPDGTKYEGEFKEGAMHGEGTMSAEDGSEIRSGAWAFDEEFP